MDFIGKIAADFSLQDQDWEIHRLSDYVGSKVLLYFYPKDNTPGCSLEAKMFNKLLDKLKANNVHVLGVSVDSVESHKKFVKKYNLNFPLLADIEKNIVKEYQVWVEKNMFGKKYMGIKRSSFLIDEKGVIIKHYKKVNPLNHAKEVLSDVKSL